MAESLLWRTYQDASNKMNVVLVWQKKSITRKLGRAIGGGEAF
jgi:hypothetical protein